MAATPGHQADLVLGTQAAIDHPDQHHHANIVVEPGIDDQGLERRIRIPFGRRNPGDDRFQDVIHALPGLGAGKHRVCGIDADHILDFLTGSIRVGGRQIDLVEYRNDLDSQLYGGIAIGNRLCLHPL